MSDIESNCSENIIDRDKSTATEHRKNDGAPEQQIDNASEDRNRGKIPVEKSWSHRSKDNDVRHLQTKNNTSGNFGMGLLLMQINICSNSSKTKT